MLKKIIVQMIFIFALIFPYELGKADYCDICLVDECYAAFETGPDGDGDGMSDSLELQLARQFKPILLLDNVYSEKPYVMPETYSTPPYANEWYPSHGLPDDIVSDGTVYFHVRPFGGDQPGHATYIEIAYWYYFSYSQAECENGPLAAHGHDWEHVALCLTESPDNGELEVTGVFFAQHTGFDIRGQDDVQWSGTPGLSHVKVYIVNGSHASYPTSGQRCAFWLIECACWENPNGQFEFQIEDSMLIPLWEVGHQRAPQWLSYSQRWPGHHSHNATGHHDPPYGPAQGDHATWWNYGHFYSRPWCIRTNLVSVPEPVDFEVSRFKDLEPIDNALYLTWEDPLSGPEDGFAIMRKRGGNCYDDSGYICIAELDSSVHEYTDSCLDGGYTYCYKLETFHDNPEPLYKGCSLPDWKWETATGVECPSKPNAPQIYSCDSCILRWNDRSYNEEGFTIIFAGADTAGQVGPDTTRFYLTNCNTGKKGYKVCAYNLWGQNCTPSVSVNSVIEVVSPNGAEELIPGDFHDIVWTREVFYGPVKLEYSTDDGTTWITIDDTTENDGFYYWEVPQSPSSLCRVMVYDVVDSIPRDSSDNSFTICNAGICNINPATLDFDTVDVGDSSQMSYTIENTGCGTVSGVITACSPEFSVSPSSYNLEANQSATITVTLRPQDCGVRTCTIDNHGGACSSVNCSGTGGGPAICEINPTSLDFDTVYLGQSSEMQYTVTNAGCGAVSGSITACAPEFTASPGSYSLGPHQSASITVTFTPQDCGPRSCTMSNEGGCTTVSCSGTGGGPVCEIDPTQLSFGSVYLFHSSHKQYTITNTGCETLSGSITACDPEFSVLPGSYSVEPNQSVTITVTFTPQQKGGRGCSISNNGGGCTSVSCSGNGVEENGGNGGGCPFLFAWNGAEFEEDNTILAACEINPEVAVTDYYMLSKTLVPTDKEYRLQIREFEDQVTFLDMAQLVAVDHVPEIKVAVTPQGSIFGYEKGLLPIACVDQDGRDHLSKITRKDGIYFVSEEPGYLIVTYSTRTVWPNVLYDPPPIEPDVAVPPWQKRAGIVSHVVVEVQDIRGEWIKVGDVPPRFYPERSYWIVGTGDLELGEEFKVKLSWDAYYAADELKYYIRSKEQPINVWSHPVAAINSEGAVMLEQMLNSDGEYATLMPGQTIELCFPVSSHPQANVVRDFVLETRGYYINLKRPSAPPTSFALLNNYPNPFNASTVIPYNLAQATDVRLEVFNLTGQRVRLLVDEHQSAGHKKAVWDGKDDKGMDVSSGIYFYRLETDNYSDSKKMVLVR